MQELVALASIVAALAIGVVSPGPSFVMVARVAVASTRRRALAAALGMGVGGAMFGAAALLGLQSVLLAVPALYAGLKIVGGLYLCYLGYLIFRSAPRPLAVAGADGEGSRQGSRGPLRAFWLGVTTQISNPKTAIVYASVFAAFLPASFSTGFAAVLLAAVFLVEAAWYALVALLFSSSGPQRAYLSYKSWVDRAAGAVMLGLGLKLVTSAAKP
jgi:threonine/homoserine/homoserine lactone efflux protein